MKEFNLSKGTIYVPLKANEEVVNGAVYEVLDGKAQKVTSSGATGNLLGVCEGGDNIREGYIMLDIDPTSAFTEAYESDAPAIGAYVEACKLVIAVDTVAKTYTYLVRKQVTVSEYELPTASATVLGGIKVGTGLTIADGVLSVAGE